MLDVGRQLSGPRPLVFVGTGGKRLLNLSTRGSNDGSAGPKLTNGRIVLPRRGSGALAVRRDMIPERRVNGCTGGSNLPRRWTTAAKFVSPPPTNGSGDVRVQAGKFLGSCASPWTHRRSSPQTEPRRCSKPLRSLAGGEHSCGRILPRRQRGKATKGRRAILSPQRECKGGRAWVRAVVLESRPPPSVRIYRQLPLRGVRVRVNSRDLWPRPSCDCCRRVWTTHSRCGPSCQLKPLREHAHCISVRGVRGPSSGVARGTVSRRIYIGRRPLPSNNPAPN